MFCYNNYCYKNTKKEEIRLNTLKKNVESFLKASNKYDYLETLSFNKVKELLTLMYIGRDNINRDNPEKLTENEFKSELNSLFNFDTKEKCIDSLDSKSPEALEMYFDKVLTMI